MKDAINRSLAPWIVLGFAALVFGARIHLPLLEPEEARYAEIPRQMLVADRFLVPIHDGQDYLDKPPLLYWLVIGSYRLFGVHDWSARLPTVLAAWLTVGVVLWWGWRTSGPIVGLAGAAVLTLTPDFVYRAPMLTMNGPLALFVTASLAFGHVAIQDGVLRWHWWTASAASCGLGLLAKGPVAAALVAAPIFAWPYLDRRLALLTWRAWLAGAGVALGVAAPWFVAVAIQRPEFVEYFFWKHHIERFAAPFDHAGPVWAYVPQLAIGFLPWTLAVAWLVLCQRVNFGWHGWHALSVLAKGVGVVQGFTPFASTLRACHPTSSTRKPCVDKALAWASFRASQRPEHACDAVTLRLALAAGVWGFAFFSLSGSKRPVYLVAVEPALALAAGAFLYHVRASLSRPTWIGLGVPTALVIVAGVAFWLPAYSRLFSVAAVVHLAKDAGLPADVPVYCYGHGWDSVGFYLERNHVKTFLGADRAAIRRELVRHETSLVFVTTKSEGDGIIDMLPLGFSFHSLGGNRQVRLGIVAPPDNSSLDLFK